MRCRLRTVHDRHSADRTGAPHHVLHRHQRSQHVGGVSERDHLRARPHDAFQLAFAQTAVRIHLQVGEARTGLLAHELPGHQVAVMLRHGKGDLVAFVQAVQGIAVRHQVERLRGVAREHDLSGKRPHEGRHLLTRPLVRLGGSDAFPGGASVRVAFSGSVEILYRLQHAARFERGGGVVQIRQAAPPSCARRLRQGREVRGAGRLRGMPCSPHAVIRAIGVHAPAPARSDAPPESSAAFPLSSAASTTSCSWR